MFTLRSSGTEPKLKYYIELPAASREEALGNLQTVVIILFAYKCVNSLNTRSTEPRSAPSPFQVENVVEVMLQPDLNGLRRRVEQ